MEKVKIKCKAENTSNARYCCGYGYELPQIIIEAEDPDVLLKKEAKPNRKK